jgi:hypothetical protein
MRSCTVLLAVALLAGCATLKRDKPDERYGPAEPAGFNQPRWTTTVQVFYGRDVEPGSPANDLAGRLLWRSLAQKGAHPLQAGGVLPDSFDFGIVRDNACRRMSEVQACEQVRP